MSSLIKTVNATKFALRNNAVLVTAVRNHWNKDYMPGPVPRTPQERAAAAEKYGLLKEEYECYPDDGDGIGDYPKMPMEPADSRDPFYPWDFPELKRNYQEILHRDFDLIRGDRVDVTYRPRFSLTTQIVQFLSVMIGSFIIFYYCENFRMGQRATAHHLPGPGKKHYTFEPCD